MSDERKKGDLQSRIIYEILQNGIQSKTSLKTRIYPNTNNYYSISKAVDSLEKKHKIEKVLERDGSQGKARKYYSITDSTLYEIIKKPELEPYDFWHIIINSFYSGYQYSYVTKKKMPAKIRHDKKNLKKHTFVGDDGETELQWIVIEKKRKFNIDIDEAFDLYEKNHYKISRNHFNSLVATGTSEIVRNIFEKRKDYYQKIIPILEVLGFNGKLEHDEIFRRIKIKELQIETFKQLIADMSINGLVIQWFDKDLQVGLSHFGLLLLFINLAERLENPIDKQTQNSSQLYYEQFQNSIDLVIIKNQDLLPLVFSHWDELRTLFQNGDMDLLTFLLRAHFTSPSQLLDDVSTNSDVLLQMFQQVSEKAFHERFLEEYTVGVNVFKEWGKKMGCLHYILDPYQRPGVIVSSLGRPVPNVDISRIFQLHGDTPVRQYQYVKKDRKSNPLQKILDKRNPDDKEYKDQYFTRDISSKEDAEIRIKVIAEPLRKFGELYHMSHRTDDFLLDSFLLVKEKKRLAPVENIISFHFYLNIKMNLKDGWEKFVSKHKNDLVPWWNEWIDVYSRFEQGQVALIQKEMVPA